MCAGKDNNERGPVISTQTHITLADRPRHDHAASASQQSTQPESRIDQAQAK